MCGIFGYIGKANAVKEVLFGLEKLEYRGYDSAGLAYFDENKNIKIVKSVGKVENLKNLINNDMNSNLAIAHTRWATHGKATILNCHPHSSENFVLVHNGIIENFQKIKTNLNCSFYSETDTEVIAKLLENNFNKNLVDINEINNNILQSIKIVSRILKGSWAVELICKKVPNKIFAFKKGSPLVVAENGLESYVSSDINAVENNLKNRFNYWTLNDGNIVEISKNSVVFYDKNLNKINLEKTKKECQIVNQNLEFNHKMLKEINETPIAIKNIKKSLKNIDFNNFINELNNFNKITIIGCGTAYHAGLYGKYIIEKLVKKQVNVELASEFRYKTQFKYCGELVIAISQSGETADTIAALNLAKQNGATTAVITNVCGSSITSLCDYVFLTRAGAEVAVAATKSYVSQVYVLYIIACAACKKREVKGLDEKARDIIDNFDINFFKKFYSKKKFFFIGRLCDASTASEGALKLKEIAYVHSEGYPAGELKHGTLSLIDRSSLTIAIITQSSIKEKTLNAIHEVKARGGDVLIITQFDGLENEAQVFKLPSQEEEVMPILSVIPLQLFSYYFSVNRGINPDMPRNLAKSVTVE